MSINIIGGSGFIGNKLSSVLKSKNIDFINLDISKSVFHREKFKRCDVTNTKDLENSLNGKLIINLSAVHRDDVRPKSLYESVNVGGAKNICKIAEKKGINKIIFTSSVAIYGFAKKNADENYTPKPFNEYGKTKLRAEKVFIDWFNRDKENRTLIIIRPTVVFGEMNRGNVFNLFNQIRRPNFPMIGRGDNIKSMAYVDNLADFISYSINLKQGLHIYNYIDKPDLKIRELIEISRKSMNLKSKPIITVPYFLAIICGYIFDFLSFLLRKNFSISSIRIKKFCSDSQFNSSVSKTGFKPRYSLEDAIEKTVKYEFIDKKNEEITFISE
tara:strand:+ start:71 stop:1057 length:987 start_codon:yes stop_codon:yes gene_type:complete